MKRLSDRAIWFLSFSLVVSAGGASPTAERGWVRRTIDAASRGADGVRLADVNGDGRLDVVTGWEEGGMIRVCRHPGVKAVKEPWPAVTVGNVRSPEDAVFVDVDGDGVIDVVSSCEGRQRTMFVHWGPAKSTRYLDPGAWTTEPIPASQDLAMWMFCLPMQVDGRHGLDLIAGAKGDGAHVGWFETPPDPRRLGEWQWHPLRRAGWIMSLTAEDMDGDGDQDVLFSDRKGSRRGVWWLENPGASAISSDEAWAEHLVGGRDREVMFLKTADLDHDGTKEVVVAVRRGDVLCLKRKKSDPTHEIANASATSRWEEISIAMPGTGTGGGKAVSVGDLDLDGREDLVITCESAQRASGVFALLQRGKERIEHAEWVFQDISGTAEGIKYDLAELIDLDGDGDLDVLTCEERDGLGVIWYENPTRGMSAE